MDTTVVMAVVLIAGLVVAFAGYNIFRYSIILMGGTGGFFIGRMFFSNVLSGMVGDGIFHDMSGSAGASFIVGLFVLVAAGLSFALYKVMLPIIGAIGGGFMFGSGVSIVMGGIMSSPKLVGWIIGAIVGASLAVAAMFVENWAAIIFTAIAGARMAGYAGAYLLSNTDFGVSIGRPVANLFDIADPVYALQVGLFVICFLAVLILGLIAQFVTRPD